MCVCYIECLDGVRPVGLIDPYTVHNFKRRSPFEVGECVYISYSLPINRLLESSQQPSRYVYYPTSYICSV